MNQKVILSLSTIPPRFGMLGASLNSLINQSRKADEIHVYIPKVYRRLPEHNFFKPNVQYNCIFSVKKDCHTLR